MLRIAVPNKGSLSESAIDMLREAGYRTRRDPRELIVHDEDNDAEFFYLRPRDIAVYVGSGKVDAGITGRDLLGDSGSTADEILELGFGRSTFRFAARADDVAAIDTGEAMGFIAGKRVATSYPHLVRDHLLDSGVEAEVVRLDGAVETAITLGVADVIADVVQTGATLRSQGLEVFGEPILLSEAVLIRRHESDKQDKIKILRRRLMGVIRARSYVMMDYDVPVLILEQACALTPGLESPTVSPLADPEWKAVRAMVPRTHTNALMDELYDLGARAIIVTEISACRL